MSKQYLVIGSTTVEVVFSDQIEERLPTVWETLEHAKNITLQPITLRNELEDLVKRYGMKAVKSVLRELDLEQRPAALRSKRKQARMLEVKRLVESGMSYQQIAQQLGISPTQAKTDYRRELFRLQVSERRKKRETE